MEEWLDPLHFFFCWPFLVWGKTHKNPGWGEVFSLAFFFGVWTVVWWLRIRHFYASKLPARRPNSMNNYGNLAHTCYTTCGGWGKVPWVPMALGGFLEVGDLESDQVSSSMRLEAWQWNKDGGTEGETASGCFIDIDGVGFHECWIWCEGCSWIGQTTVLLLLMAEILHH